MARYFDIFYGTLSPEMREALDNAAKDCIEAHGGEISGMNELDIKVRDNIAHISMNKVF